ncbi:MAG: hypothetical protein ACFFDI_30570 [Promethearchaeota archaeon]
MEFEANSPEEEEDSEEAFQKKVSDLQREFLAQLAKVKKQKRTLQEEREANQ